MAKIRYYIDTFNYFKTFDPDILSKKVLDYGSNYGLFLDSSKNQFNQSQYTGIDVDLDALAEGKKRFPSATFIHINKYNIVYNVNGIKNFRLDLNKKFDTIISYSVLTHTTIDDFFNTIDNLYNLLDINGRLHLTFLDVNHEKTRNCFYKKRIRDFGSCDTIYTDDYIYLLDNKVSKKEYESSLFLLF